MLFSYLYLSHLLNPTLFDLFTAMSKSLTITTLGSHNYFRESLNVNTFMDLNESVAEQWVIYVQTLVNYLTIHSRNLI